jgi:signal transduction histidine kinase
VRDTGRGIPSDKLEKIFERFEQLERSGTRLGFGLGLAISRQLVEAQGGHIWAESDLGAGSRFFFTLPACTNTFVNESAPPQASEAQ